MKKQVVLAATAIAATAGIVLPSAGLGGAYPGTNGPIAWLQTGLGMGASNFVNLYSEAGAVSGTLAIAGAPSFSEDGRKMAWVDGNSVKVANTDASSTVTVISGAEVGTQTSLSPDGTKVAVVRQSTSQGIYLVNATAGQTFASATLVTASGVNAYAPQFSPDGTKIAYVRAGSASGCNSGSPLVVWVATIASPGAGSELAGSCDGTAGEGASSAGLSWSPDGTKIAFPYGSGSGGTTLRTIPATGGSLSAALYTRSGSDTIKSPSFSPDGTKIAFVTGGFGPSPTLRIIPAAGGSAQSITAANGANSSSWAPPLVTGGDSGGNTPTPTPTTGGGSTTPAATTPISGPAATLATPTVNTSGPGENAVVTVKVQLEKKGKYTFIFERSTSNEMSREQATSNRVSMQKGSKIGKRLLKKAVTAAVITTTEDNAKLVTRALLRKAQAKKLNLRVIYAPTGTAQSESVIKIK